MKEMMEAHPNVSNSPYSGVSSSSPVILTGSAKDSSGANVTYTATLSMQPTNCVHFAANPPEDPDSRQSHKTTLNALRQSPYFASDLLEESRNCTSRNEKSKRKYGRSELREFEELERYRSSAFDIEGFDLPSESDASEDVDRLLIAVGT